MIFLNKVSKTIVAAVSLLGIVLSLGGCASSSKSQSSKTLTVVFLPSDSAKEESAARTDLSKKISEATGKKVKVQTTTDYNVAINAISSGKAQIALMGPDGYIEAHKQNSQVKPLVTYSGKSGTLKDAKYYSYLMVPKNKASNYQTNGKYDLSKIKHQRILFVSTTSTSGYAIPAGALKKTFKLKNEAQLQKSGAIFSKVLYGQSHQGSALNLFKGDADVAAFDDIDMVSYGKFSGNKTGAGATYTVNNDAPAPFNAVRGKQSTAIAAYAVQNEPIVANEAKVSKSDVKKIVKALTSKEVTNDQHFFAKPGSKTRGMFTKEGKTHFIAVSDKWYAPTHKVLGK